MDHGDQKPQRQGVYAYEPVTQVFPEGQVPTPVPSGPLGPITGTAIPLADFMQLTKIPIEIIWGDNFPTANQSPSVYPDIEIWQGRIIMAQKFVDLIKRDRWQRASRPPSGHWDFRQHPFRDVGPQQRPDRGPAVRISA